MNTSNIGQVMGFLKGFVESFDFTRPGIDQSLGRDVKNKAVERIYKRSNDDKRSIDDDWEKNEKEYAKWKEEKYDVIDGPNERTGQMLSQKSIEGRSTIEPRQVTLIYGTNTPPDKCRNGGEPSKEDKARTDVQKAYYAHTGQSIHKIKRKFYQLDESDGKAIVGLCQENLNDYIRDSNQQRGVGK